MTATTGKVNLYLAHNVGKKTGDAASAAYMFRQTAGGAYYRAIKEGSSIEDAYALSGNEGALSAVIEFGMGRIVEHAGGKIVGKISTETGEVLAGTLVKKLLKAGMSEKGAKVVIRAADFVAGNLGEGAEEWLQQGASITAERIAKEGRKVSLLEYAVETLDLSNYSSEEFDSMNDSFKAGFIVGTFHSTVRVGLDAGITGASTVLSKNNSKSVRTAYRMLKGLDEAEFGKTILAGEDADSVVNKAIVHGRISNNADTVALANSIYNKMQSGEEVSASDVGKLSKQLLLQGDNFLAEKSADEVMYQVKDEDGNVVNRSLKSDEKSGKINSKDSKQSGVMWTMADGVLDNREVAAFYSKISEMKKQGYKNFNRTTDGDYIFEINNKLVVTDGKYMTPTITDVFTFESENETINAIAREAFYEQTQSGRTVRDAQSFVEIVYGEGFIKRNDIGDSGSYAQMRNGRRKGSAGAEIDSQSGKNVDDFDKLVAMGTNEYAESARARTENTESGEDTDVLASIEEEPKGKASGVTAADIMSGNIHEGLRARLESFKKVIERMGFTVVYESHREMPKNTIGYVDFTNREVYLSPANIDEALLTHELTHIIDKGFSGKYVQSLTSFFKNNLSEEWDKKYNEVKAKYEGIAKKNEGFTYTDSTLEAETLAEMCTEFTTDEYIKKAANMEVGTIKQVIVMFNYVRVKLKSIFMDTSSDQKFKVASLKWQLALYKATKKGEAGRNVSFGVMYSTEKTFAEQLRETLSGKVDDGNLVYVCETPMNLKKLGLNGKPMLITRGHLRDVNHEKSPTESKYHGVSEKTIAKLPYILSHPAIVFDSISERNPDSICILSEETDSDGIPLIIAIKPDGNGMYNNVYIESNIIGTMYGPDNFESFISRLGEKGENVLYMDEKRTQDILESRGSQFPTGLSDLKFNTILHQSKNVVKKKKTTNDDVFTAVADDESSIGTEAYPDDDFVLVYDSKEEARKEAEAAKADSGAVGTIEAAELEESINLISEALKDEELSRTDRVALITERTKHRKRLAEIKGDTDEGKVSRRASALEEYRETGDPGVLPSEDSIRASDRYDKKRIAEIRQEFAQVQEALRNDKDMTTHDREDLMSRKEALTAQLQQIAENNSVLSEIKDIVDGFGTGEHISHEWVNEASPDLSDPTVGGMVRQGVYNTNDVERNFKRFFGKHYGEAYDKVLKPFYESKKAYAEGVVKYAKLIREEVVKKLGIKEGTKESAAVMWLGEGKRPLTQKELVADLGRVGAKRLRKQIRKGEVSEQFTEYTYEDCVKEFGKEKADNILAATKVFRKCYDELIAEINTVRAEIYPNNPDKLIKKRADYFRHFNEISNSIKGLRAAVTNNQGIDPTLVGVSEHTEPKSKWQSWEQKRMGNKTTYDAVGGFLDYLMSAEYAIYIDKNIVNFRSLARDLALAKSEEAGGAGNPNANGFIRYLQRFANHLAGKTVNGLDRAIADMPHGRQMIAVLNWMNNRAKANAVLGNMSSVVAQVSNIKNAVGKIDKTWYLWKGAAEAFGGMFGKDNKIQRRYDESGFLKERFMGDEIKGFETNWKKVWHAPKNFAAWVLGFADEVGTRITYNAAYNQALARGISNPAEYADSFTRSCVAGRGIGDVPLVLQSQVAKLFMPFRVEVLNDMNVRADMLFGRDTEGNKVKVHKRIWRYTRFLVFCSVMNALIAALKGDGFSPVDDIEEGFEEAEKEGKEGVDKFLAGLGNSAGNLWEDYVNGYGDGVAYDPLGDIAQGIYEGMQEGESAGGDIGHSVMRSFQNLFGDYMSNNPFASAAVAVTGADEDVLDKITNGNLYTPAGAGSPVFSTLWTTAKELVDGDYATAGKEIVTDFLLPWGGSQVDKSVRGMYEYETGYSTTENAYERMAGKGGKLKYLIEPKHENFIKSLLFGPASFSEANDYYYTEDPYKLSEDDTKEVLKEKDYEGRKVKFDDIVLGKRYKKEFDLSASDVEKIFAERDADKRKTILDEIIGWNKYEDEHKKALDECEAEYYGDENSALYSILYYTDENGEKKRRNNVLPYGNFTKSIGLTVDDRKVNGTITVEKAKEMNALMGERLEYWYDMLNETEDFAKLSEENKVSIVSAVYNIEKDYMVAQELYRQGVITDYEYQNYGYDYVVKCAEKLTDIDSAIMAQYAEDALEEWVNDRENPEKFAKYNAANTAKLFLDNAYFMDDATKAEVERYYETESGREPDDVDKELARLSYETRDKLYVYGNPYSVISFTKNYVKYALKVPAEDIYGIFETSDTQVRRNLAALFKKKSYQNASDEDKAKMVSSVRNKVQGELRKRYKKRYAAVRIEDAYERATSDSVAGEVERFYDSHKEDDIDIEVKRVGRATKDRVRLEADVDDIFSYTEGGVDYSIQVPDSDVYEIFSGYDTQMRSELSSLFSETRYTSASDVDKKKMIVSVRDKVRNRIRSSIKLKYPSVKMRTLFDRIVEMKSK